MVPHLPVSSRQNRISVGNRAHLEFWIWRERLLGKDDVRLGLLLWISLPFHISFSKADVSSDATKTKQRTRKQDF